jgi:hypothetical protein
VAGQTPSAVALSSPAGTLTVTRSTITDNIADGPGGITNTGGTVTITTSTIEQNHGAHEAGGLANYAGTVSITASTFAHNSADGGAAISNFEGGVLTVTNSAFTDNVAFGTGPGAIGNLGTLVVINTTFARNTATGFIPENGAAIKNLDTLLLINSTLVDNQVTGPNAFGSALASESGATTLLQNTRIAHNVGHSFPGETRGPDCVGVVTSLGTNLIGDPTGCTITLGPNDLTGDPGLGDFTDNGRPGNGHFPLLKTSQAIGAGSEALCPRTDQLGRRRIGPCDIGAIAFRDRDDHQHDEEDDQHDKDLAAAAQAAQ